MKAYLTYKSNNIGDDFQSVVTAELLGEPNLYLRRTELPDYTGRAVDLILNGYIARFAKTIFPFSEKINPIFLAACLGPRGPHNPKGALATIGDRIVGCRDRASVRWCKENGVEGRYMACPSILKKPTLKRRRSSYPIRFIDVDPAPFAVDNEVAIDTQIVNEKLSFQHRQEVIQQKLFNLERSSLVVTSRIHVAMPAVGMGVPVIFVNNRVRAPFRLTALPQFMPIYSVEEAVELDLSCPDKFLPAEGDLEAAQNTIRRKARNWFGLEL